MHPHHVKPISNCPPIKVDFERLANKAQITVASARTMYPKAKKKFRELHDSDATSPEDTTSPTGDSGTPKAKKTRAPPKPRGRKRKQVDDDSADVKGEPAESADEPLQQVEA